MATLPILKLSDGTTTCNFIWHSAANRGFILARDSWAPQIAPLRRSTLGGAGPYEDVVEEITVHICGESDVEVYQNQANLVKLLDQAERFWRLGQAVSPVLLHYAPIGASKVLQAMVLGRAPGDESGIGLPTTYNSDLGAFMVRNVRIRILRRGLWLNPLTESGSSSVAGTPTVQTVTLPSNVDVSSPYSLQFDFSVSGTPGSGQADSAVVLTASAASRLQIYEAESATSLGSNLASQADAANLARGGSVLRYSPGTLLTTFSQTLSGFDSTARRFSVWAAVRNNSATTTWQIQATAAGNNSYGSTTPWVPIGTENTVPRIIHVGILQTRTALASLQFYLQASAASGNLDIDYFIIHAIDDDSSAAIGLISNADNAVAFNPVVIDPKVLTDRSPWSTAGTLISGYEGDAVLMSRGTTIAAVWLSTFSNYWRLVDGTNAAMNAAITAVRNTGYLIPR